MKKNPDTLVVCVGYTRKQMESKAVRILFEEIVKATKGDKLLAYATALQNLLKAETHEFITNEVKDKILILAKNKISKEDCFKAASQLQIKCFIESKREIKKVLEINEKGAFEYETYEHMEFLIPLTETDFQTYLV